MSCTQIPDFSELQRYLSGFFSRQFEQTLYMFDLSQSVTVEVHDSVSEPVSDQSAGTEASCTSKLENHMMNPVVRVTSLKSSENRTAGPLHAVVRVGDSDCSSQCAVRFPKVHVGVTSGACH